MSLRGRVTTEAISYLIDIIEIATAPERRFAMTTEDSRQEHAGMTAAVSFLSFLSTINHSQAVV